MLMMMIFHNDFPHIRQERKWDCGIACVAMVMVKFERDEEPHRMELEVGEGIKLEFKQVLDKLQNQDLYGFGCRPWTVDLCHILQTMKVPYRYFTSHPGMTVNENLSKLNYYASSSFKQDASRIAALLRFNPDLTFHTTPKITCMDEATLLKNLDAGPLLVLTDGNRLRCRRCLANSKIKWIINSCRGVGRFAGHYVLVIGWRAAGKYTKEGIVYYRDPAATHELCHMKQKRFTKARQAFGTDEDIITIIKNEIQEPNNPTSKS